MTEINKSFTESVIGLAASIGLIYLSALGMVLNNWLQTGTWTWTFFVIATVLSVIPATKEWISRNANIQLDKMRAEAQVQADAWQSRFDTLKDENNALQVNNGLLKFQVENMTKFTSFSSAGPTAKPDLSQLGSSLGKLMTALQSLPKPPETAPVTNPLEPATIVPPK